MWINDTIEYTPEEQMVKKGPPTKALIEGVSVDGTTFSIRLPDGSKERVESRLCLGRETEK